MSFVKETVISVGHYGIIKVIIIRIIINESELKTFCLFYILERLIFPLDNKKIENYNSNKADKSKNTNLEA